jgi:hypothetical protein
MTKPRDDILCNLKSAWAELGTSIGLAHTYIDFPLPYYDKDALEKSEAALRFGWPYKAPFFLLSF